MRRKLFTLAATSLSLSLFASTVFLLCSESRVLYAEGDGMGSPLDVVSVGERRLTLAVHREYRRIEVPDLARDRSVRLEYALAYFNSPSAMVSYDRRWSVAGVSYESFDRLFRVNDGKKVRADGASGHSRSLRVSLYLPLLVSLVFPAAIAWKAIVRIRAGLRGRRGLCPTCGYDLRGNSAGRCPECGSIVAGVDVTRPARV